MKKKRPIRHFSVSLDKKLRERMARVRVGLEAHGLRLNISRICCEAIVAALEKAERIIADE